MTTLDTALAGADITNAAKPSTVLAYLWVESRPTKATARINQASFTYPLSQFEVDGTSNWSTVTPGDTVLIGTTAGASDVGVYRVRASDSDTLVIGETSEGDPGLLPAGVRVTAFGDNQYVTVTSGRNLWSVLPFIANPDIFEDKDTAASNSNTNPAPLAYVQANGENNHYGCFVDSGQVYATIVFVADKTLWPTSASVTYAWTAPAAWGAPTAGATNTSTVTYHVPRSVAEYEMKLVVTENSVNQTQTRIMKIWVSEKTGTYAPFAIAELPALTWNDTGAGFSFTLNDALLASVPTGAMVHIGLEARFGGATIASAVTHFTGWLVRATKTAGGGLRSANIEFVGPAGVLDMRRGTSQIWGVSFDSSTWQYVPPNLISLSYAIWWLLHTRARNVLELFGLNLYSTSAVGQRLPQIEVGSATLWQQVTSLADGIGKRHIGCDPDGTIWVQPEPNLFAYGNRSNIVKRDTLTESIVSEDTLTREYFGPVGYVEAESFIWDGSSAQPTPNLAYAAGSAPGQGAADDKVQNQVLTEQADLDTLVELFYAMRNPDYSGGTLKIPGARGLLYKPAQKQMIRYTKAAVWDAENVAFDRYLIISSVTLNFLGGGATETEITVTVETAGLGGTTKVIPPVNTDIYTGDPVVTAPPAFDLQLPEVTYPDGPGLPLASVPPAALTPAGGKIAHFTGEELLSASPTKIYWLKNIIKLHTPQYNDITPTDFGAFTCRAVAVNPFLTPTVVPGYHLRSDGTDSLVARNPNVAQPGAASTWVVGATESGEYNVLRVTKTQGGILIYSPAGPTGSPSTVTYDFTVSNHGFTNRSNAVYTPGVGWQSTTGSSFSITSPGLGAVNVTQADWTFDASGTIFGGAAFYVNIEAAAAGQGYGAGSAQTKSYSSSHSQGHISGGADGIDDVHGGLVTITKLVLTSAPFGGAISNYSSDYGATWAGAEPVGDSPGTVGGFDVQAAGNIVYASATEKVRKATTPGGPYIDFAAFVGANPVCVVTPWYKQNSITLLNTSTSTPDCVVALDTADGDGGSLYWVDGATAAKDDITPTAGMIFDSANCITTFYGKNIGVIGKVSGVYKYYYSLNGGTTWTAGSTLTAPTQLRTRRRDNIRKSGSPASGQIYIADPDTILYSSKWGSNSIASNTRVLPASGITMFDTVY